MKESLSTMRSLAGLAMQRYDLGDTALELWDDTQHSAIFRLTLPAQLVRENNFPTDFATLKFAPAEFDDPQHLEAEVAWLLALHKDTELCVQVPLPAEDGSYIQSLPCGDQVLLCVLYSWVPGRFFDRGLRPGKMRAAGRLTGTLHAHSRSYTGRARVPMGQQAYYLEFDTWLPATLKHPSLKAGDRDIVERAARFVQRTLQQKSTDPAGYGLVHGDLHQWNTVYTGVRANAIDFGDCGWGYFTYDMATTLMYLKHPWVGNADHSHRYPEYEAAFLEGYSEITTLPPDCQNDLDFFMLARIFMILNWQLNYWPKLDYLPWGPGCLRRALRSLAEFIDAS